MDREQLAKDVYRDGYEDASAYIRSYDNLPESFKERWRKLADYVNSDSANTTYLELGE